MGCPLIILNTPNIIAKPTEAATTNLSTVASILPAEILAALSAITDKAGSAIVVPKPIKNPKISIHVVHPDFAKSLANPSPTGNIPISRPCKKIAKPIPTITKPMAVETQFSGTL